MSYSKLQELEDRIEALETFTGIRLNYKIGIEPIGEIDGINTEYSLLEEFKLDSLAVYINGAKQTELEDFIILDNSTFSFLYILDIGDILRVNYILKPEEESDDNGENHEHGCDPD